jgi:hypothetical protein
MTVTAAEYFEALWSQRTNAVSPIVQRVRFRDGTPPLPGRCHENVDQWVLELGEGEAVRGWAVMSYGFERHSLFKDAGGELIDITLTSALPFVPHDGTQELFDWFGKNGLNQVFWPPRRLAF